MEKEILDFKKTLKSFCLTSSIYGWKKPKKLGLMSRVT